jgi:hypothetical protein
VTHEAILGQPRVHAVLLTWNRMRLLTQSLTMVGARTRPRDVPVVVDQASTDGSRGVIRARFPDVDPVTSTGKPGNPDLEHIGRILRHRKGIYVFMAFVVHKTADPVDPGVGFYHEFRNKIRVWCAGAVRAPAQAGYDQGPIW